MFTNFTTKNVYTPMRNCEIKFVNKREFDVRKVLKKLWEWNIFSNFIGDNQRVTNKYPFP